MLGAHDLEFISRVAVFGGLTPESMRHVGALARRVEFDGPAVVFGEGDPARELVIVLAGELEVRKRGKSGADMRIAVLHAGDCAGEMSIVDIQPRSALVRSLGPAALAVLSVSDLAQLYREDGAAYTMLVLNIAREISRRLRRVDALLADIMLDVQEVWTGALEVTGQRRETLG